MSDAPFNELWKHGKQAGPAAVLIKAGASVDGLPASGETPLRAAASLGETAVARVLIEHGANIQAVAKYLGIPHGTPLDFAVHFGMVEVVDVQVSQRANILSTRMGKEQLSPSASRYPTLKEKLNPADSVLRCPDTLIGSSNNVVS